MFNIPNGNIDKLLKEALVKVKKEKLRNLMIEFSKELSRLQMQIFSFLQKNPDFFRFLKDSNGDISVNPTEYIPQIGEWLDISMVMAYKTLSLTQDYQEIFSEKNAQYI